MMRTHLVPLAAWLAFAGLPAVAPAAEKDNDKDRPLKVLFLGDQGHHNPADRAAQLIPIMAGRGIDITYTENLDDLNRDTLGKYDALVIYANTERIAKPQEQALLDYVAGGGGFVPIHCASFCFLNSPEYIALVGAQFKSHGTGEFDVKVVDPDHPITRGLDLFRTWDETYVHTKHNTKDRHLLEVRSEGAHDEPWTWVRTHGKGRVFYTAYGHDARTWEKPGFHDLIERGIRWASGRGDVQDSRLRVASGLKPFEYEEAASGIPNYIAGAKWGTQGEPSRRMQKPIPADESMKHLAVPRGFKVELFATEPDIAKPITMAWDHRGRLWIAESTDYPNNKLDRRATGHDRIKVLEDSDGDGRADKFTVFAEGLNIPTSLAFARGGVVVLQAPDTLLLRDTDGDGKADERTVLFTGWGTDDTHAGPSNLRWGFDNWIWGIVGYSGFRGTVGGERLSFRQGFYRFKPDGSKLEFLRSTNNNSWGVGFSEEGIVFGSTANGCPSVYLAVPNRYYEAVRGWSVGPLANAAPTYNYYPITDKVRKVDWFGGFTAAAGHALYTARTYPEVYWNQTAFVSDPTGHLTATFTFQPKGSDFVTYNGWNLLASDDEWTAPIMAEVGPDGQVWIIDWYNYIVQHNPTPQGFKTGRGNAYETPLRDKTHGRIYRVVATEGTPSKQPKLDPDDPKGLVAALTNDNMFWRTHAQRLLVERGKDDVVPDLVRLVKDESRDALGLNPGAIHALAVLNGLGALDQKDEARTAAVAALRHRSAGVRRNALAVLPRTDASTKALLDAGVLDDRDAQVRLAALLALAEMPPSEAAGRALVSALSKGLAEKDRWLRDAATAASARHDRAFLDAVAAREKGKLPESLLRIVPRVAEHTARGAARDVVGPLLTRLPDADPKVTEAIVAGLARGWPTGRPAQLDDKAEEALARLLPTLSDEGRGQLISLANRWGTRALEKHTAATAAALLAAAQDESKSNDQRIGAARQLIALKPADADAAKALLDLIQPRTAPELATGLIEAVGRSAAPEAGVALVEHLAALTPAVRPAAVRLLIGRNDWTAALLDALEKGTVPLTYLALDQQEALTAHRDLALSERAKRLLARGGGLPDPDRQKVIDALSKVALRGGDPVKGKKIFTEQCAKCHRHSGEGNTVGPDLTGMAAHPRDELLVSILDPSRSVEGNYIQYNLATNDGRILNGLLASETKSAVELVDAEGKRHAVLRDEIEELAASKKSLMPEGFEKQVGAEGLADLTAFLTQRGKYLPLDLRKVATAVSTKGMFYSEDSPVERLVFPDWSPKTVEGVPFQLVDPQGSRVPNVVLLNGPQGTLPPRMPKSVSLPCHAPARAIHLLGAVSGWGYPGGTTGSVSMIVRLHYEDGQVEDHPLKNGVHLADYIRVIDVPESKLAFRLQGRQVRYLAVEPKRDAPIASVELVKGSDDTAPIVVAVTVEGKE